jgi:hypothetical protein
LTVIGSGQFGHMKFKLIFLGLIIAFSVRGQETIRGLVYDKTGPTPGVMVTELGTDNKVVTDAKGEFEIKTKATNPTLTFKFIGFHSRTIKIKKNKFLNVKMKWDRPKYKDIARSNDRPTVYISLRGF